MLDWQGFGLLDFRCSVFWCKYTSIYCKPLFRIRNHPHCVVRMLADQHVMCTATRTNICLHRTQNIKLTKLAKLSTSVSRIAHHYVLWNCRVQWMKNVSSHQHTKTPCFVQLQLKLRTPLKFGNESDFGYKKVHYDFNFYASVEALSQCVAP
jgi:hypothetical protein